MISVSKEYETAIDTLCHIVADFGFRSRWQEGVKSVDAVNHLLPRVGARHCYVLEKGELITYTSSFSYTLEQVVFSETDEMKKTSIYFILEKKDDNTAKLTLDFYISKNILSELIFNLRKKRKVKAAITRSMRNLTELVGQIQILK